MFNNRQQLIQQLNALEQEMLRLDLWTMQSPDATAMASEQPFCHDSMHFHNWLQWLFIPKMLSVATSNIPLPSTCAITPMAELLYAAKADSMADLLTILKHIDDVFDCPVEVKPMN